MYKIEMEDISAEFKRCWQAACEHIEMRIQGPRNFWLKADLTPPFLEHLSFRLGNQLFFIRLEDTEGVLEVPGSRQGLHTIAEGCKGHACLMPMRRRAGNWEPAAAGWGILDIESNLAIDPFALVNDERIEMTDWELHDCAVCYVLGHLQKAGRPLLSWHTSPEVDPSIWFKGESDAEWMVVRAVRYPTLDAVRLSESELADLSAKTGRVGHFVSVSIASADDAFDPGNIPATPLWRGHATLVRFKGLVTDLIIAANAN